MECKTIHFLRKPRPQRTAFSSLFGTAIDDLTLFEHQINLLNGPLILMQLLKILLPAQQFHPVFGNDIFCLVMVAVSVFSLLNRAYGGTVIAGARQVNRT